MSRTQYLHYMLPEAGILTSNEVHLLEIVKSRPQYYLENLSTLAASMNKSRRTVQYIINKLVMKGFLKKKYTTFKRMILTITSMEEQKKLMSGGMIAQVFKYCAFKKRPKINKLRHDVQPAAHIDVQPTAYSISNSNKNHSILSTGLKIMKKGFKSDFELRLERDRQVALARTAFN